MLPSYSPPEICECRQRQISQLDHGRLWVTSEPSFHLPATLRNNSTRRLHHFIASPVFASTLGGVRSGNDQKWATWHSVIFLALSIPRHSTTGHFHLLQHPLSGRLVWRFAFDSRKPDGRAPERKQSEEGQSPFRLTLWLLNSNHFFALVKWSIYPSNSTPRHFGDIKQAYFFIKDRMHGLIVPSMIDFK